MNTVIKGKQL